MRVDVPVLEVLCNRALQIDIINYLLGCCSGL